MNKKHKHYDCIVAWAEGKTIEYLNKHYNNWTKASNPSWDINTEYRIKPEKVLTPYTIEDAKDLLGFSIKDKNRDLYYIITFVSDKGVGFSGGGLVTFKDLLSNYIFLSGVPCGKLTFNENNTI